MRRVSISMIGVFVVVMVCLGGVVGMIVVSPPAPAALSGASSAEIFPVSPREFSDKRTVDVAVKHGAPRTLVAPTGGVLTAADCASGAALVSGTVPFRIGGRAMLVLATAVPLWRDLAPGASGPDVKALEQELVRLGGSVTPDETFTAATLTAFRQVLAKAGGDIANVDSVALDRVMWIPASPIPVTGCPVAVGTQISAGTVLAELPSLVLGAAVTTLPPDLAPGDRVIQIDDQSFVVDASGALNQSDLDRFASTPSFSAAQKTSPAQTITGALTLSVPVTVYAVPPRAIVGDGDPFCVVNAGTPTQVYILASQLGQSFVRPVAQETVLSQVALHPARGTTCG